MSEHSANHDAGEYRTYVDTSCAHTWMEGSDMCVACGASLSLEDDPTVFIGSSALLTALYDTYVEHTGIVENGPPRGVEPYMWCACGWRSDNLDGHGTRSENPGLSYAVHLSNAQHAAAVVALQSVVRRVVPSAKGGPA